MTGRIIKALDTGGLLDEAFDLYKKNFLLFAGIALLVNLPVSILQRVVDESVASVLQYILAIPVSYIVIAATTQAVSETYLGRRATILASYRAVMRRAFAFTATMLLASVIIGVGYLLLIIPGIIFSCWYAFLSEVFVLEGKAWSDARNRSKQLAEGQWGRIIGLSILCGLIVAVVSLVITWPVGYLLGMGANPLEWQEQGGVLFGLAEGIANSLGSPIQVIVFVLLYYDIRVRKEGFDIQMLARSLGVEWADGEIPTAVPSSPEPLMGVSSGTEEVLIRSGLLDEPGAPDRQTDSKEK